MARNHGVFILFVFCLTPEKIKVLIRQQENLSKAVFSINTNLE